MSRILSPSSISNRHYHVMTFLLKISQRLNPEVKHMLRQTASISYSFLKHVQCKGTKIVYGIYFLHYLNTLQVSTETDVELAIERKGGRQGVEVKIETQ
jgi:hypothetical protein